MQCKTEPKKITYARVIRDVPTSKIINYPNGKVHLVIVYQKGSLSSIEYFSLTGRWDSIVYYKNARKFSSTHFNYHPDGSSERTIYKEDRITVTKQYNASHDLIYQDPIDTVHLHKTILQFKSRRTFLDARLKDTMLLINKDLPPNNRGYRFVGFKPLHIENSYPPAYIIYPEHYYRVAPYILIYLHENNEHRQLLDSIQVPVK